MAQARIGAGLTQKKTADELDWSVSKVVRIEQGTVPVAPSDVRVMLSLYQEADPARVEELVGLARQAREANNWDEYDDVVSPGFREMLGQERSASSIWMYEPLVVPGYFQTYDYAISLHKALEHPNPTRRAEVRAKRQEILELPNRPELHVITGEAALRRPVGGTDVMREQITHLIELAAVPGISLFLLPFSVGAHRGMGGPFSILQFADYEIADSLYLEDAERRTTLRSSETDVISYLELFNKLATLAESEGTFEEQASRIRHELYDPA